MKHPTIPYLEARHVVENLPYHIASAAALLWQGASVEDLRRAKEHVAFEKVRLNLYGLRPVYSYPTLQAPGIQRIIEPFPYNIATALRYLLGAQIPWDLDAAISYIDFEIKRLEKGKPNDDLWGIFNR